MKKAVFALVFLCAACAYAASNPNPADYNLSVHVSSSSLDPDTPAHLTVTIQGKTYELRALFATSGILALGDYKAKLAKDEHKSSYESLQVYEFLFPDGKTRQFLVVGMSE
jgi:hypothetical protein